MTEQRFEVGSQVDLFAIRVGCLTTLDKIDVEGLGSESDSERASEVFQSMVKRINRSPIVVAEAKTGPGQIRTRLTVREFPSESKRSAMLFASDVSFKAHWPQKNQELYYYTGPCIEDYMVTYDGLIYTVAAQCSSLINRPYSFLFGREGRRILDAILSPSDQWDLYVLGPSPMYPVFYVAFGDDPEMFPLQKDFVRDGDTLESLLVRPRPKHSELEAALKLIVDDLREQALDHYIALVSRLEFLYESGGLYDATQKATEAFEGLAKPATWDPRSWVRKVSLNTQLRQNVGSAYRHYAELEEARITSIRQARTVSESFSRNPLLEPHSNYTMEIINDVVEWKGQHLLEALRFLANESRSQGIQWATLVGPLIGALIALVATALVLVLGS